MMLLSWLVSLAAPAQAQDVEVPSINTQLFRPTLDAPGLLGTDDASRLPSGNVSTRVLFSYADEPLIYSEVIGDQTTDYAIVSSVVQVDALVGYSLGIARLGVDVPLYLYSTGAQAAAGEAGLGELRPDLKLSLLDGRQGPLGLALSGRLTLPTATVDLPLGNAGVGWEASAIVDKAFGPALIAANVGTRGLPEASLGGVPADDQLFFRLGSAFSLSPSAGLSAELSGHAPYGAFGEDYSSPLEALGGGWLRPGGRDLLVRAGLGTGINSGVGAPRFRAVAGVAFEPPLGDDSDDDGLVNVSDDCPDNPEDFDRYGDKDGCPEPTRLAYVFLDDQTRQPVPGVAFTAAGVEGGPGELPSGTYALSAAADGYAPLESSFTVEGGESLTVTRELKSLAGRLEIRVVDNTNGRLISEATWRLDGAEKGQLGQGASASLLPGEHVVAAAAPGYQPAEARGQVATAQVTALEIRLDPIPERQRLELTGSVRFDTADTTIHRQSRAFLDDVARRLRETPEATLVRIEGHTDSRGSDEYNQQLSEARAASVREYLIAQGVSAERLASVGLGESSPLDPAETEEAWAKNRRVVFTVVTWTTQERAAP